jgi:hypothetical protein
LLSDLQHEGIRLGIISNTGDDGRETVDAVLRAAGIVNYFEPGLRLYSHDIGLTKDSPRIFTKAAELARHAASPQLAVYPMDMIGYHERLPRSWEVHVGHDQPAEVEARSLALARMLRDVSPSVSPGLEPPQIYMSGTVPTGDPAAGRSDHAPFQSQGYAACVVSEDFFVGPDPESPAPQTNPNYHKAGDTVIVADFAADIARAVAVAAWVTAKPARPRCHSSPQDQPISKWRESKWLRAKSTRAIS